MANLYIRDENGDFVRIPAIQGKQGISPTVTISEISGGHRVCDC